jgi:hypothetical protein
MRFNLRPEDYRLVNAAITCGDSLAAHPLATSEQAHIIGVLQRALRRLPEESPGVDGEYGFSIVPERPEGIERSWTVSLSRPRKVTAPGRLEIFNTYTTLPDGDLRDGKHEISVRFIAGVPTRYIERWDDLIAAFVEPPDVTANMRFEINAALDSPA